MDPTYLQRLSFIKYLFSIGLYQSNQPEPLCGVSILSFHDSVELFLELSSEKLNIGKNSQGFMDYWDMINNKTEDRVLTQKESMKRLNKARVNLKHHGIIPSKLDIESFRAVTQAFFNENCPTVFEIDFDNISLIDLIKFERPKEFLKKAKEVFSKDLIKESLENLALSFEYLIIDYEKSIKDKLYRSPFFFGRSMEYLRGSLDPNYNNYGVQDLTEAIESMQKALKVLSLGIDYRKYAKFDSIVPPVQFLGNLENRKPYITMGEKIELRKEDLEFCIDFIIESSLKLQEFDFELSK